MAKKVKVIDLEAKKLDPNAKYLFLIQADAMPTEEVENLENMLYELIGDNFVLGFTDGKPSEVTHVYEFAPKEAKS